MKSLFPIILLLASVGIFVFYTNKEYEQIKELRVDLAEYEKAFGKSNEVLKKRGELQSKYAQFSGSDLESLKKLLPDHVDNVQLILDINGISRKHNMTISKIKISDDKAPEQSTSVGPDTRPYSSILVSFRTKALYSDFVSFMKDLEQGLRLVDVVNLSFKTDPKDQTEFIVTVRTYWLK